MANYQTQQRSIQELKDIYGKEQELVLSVIHEMGMERVKDEWSNSLRRQQLMPSSWLGQQRLTVGGFWSFLIFFAYPECLRLVNFHDVNDRYETKFLLS